MNTLQSKIKEASQKYYSGEDPELQDEEFDKLLEQELKQNPDSDFNKIGHGYVVDKDSTYGEKVSHHYGLVGSLPKCKTYKEFISTFKSITNKEIICSTKLDGLSIVLYFENGKLIQAITRGDGYTGIDVTNKVKHILKMEAISDTTFTGSIRGEIVMSNDNFEKFHQIHPESKNARNSAAGLMNNKEITFDLNYIDIIFYTITGSENKEFACYEEILNYLSNNIKGQKIAKWCKINLDKITSDEELTKIMNQLKDEWYGDYPYDGIVNAANELDVSGNIIQYISNAYKFKAESKETIVKSVDWSLSKTGYLIPRINFEPVQLSGATVQFCAGHNAQNIDQLKIGKGAKIKVTRSNEVIPYLEAVLELGQSYELPRICPSCGASLVQNGVHLQCPNRECKNADIQDVLIWMANIAPVKNLGDISKIKYLEELFGEEHISIETIYNHGPIHDSIWKTVKQLIFIETFNRLFTDKITLDTAILALNIPRFGDITASKLARYPDEIQKIYLDPNTTPLEKLHYLQIIQQSIGNANYQSLLDNEFKMKRLKFIQDRIIWHQDSQSEYKGDVCVTGKLSVKRDLFEEELRIAGYVLVNSVKKDTKYLITDNPNSGSSKNKSADKYNIPKLTEKEFRNKYM